jgi:hypothetical protein
MKNQIKITLDDSAKNEELFKKLKSIDITKPEIFKHGVMFLEVPEHISENDFEYLQGKIPSLEGLIGEFIDLENDKIINKSEDDRIKKIISEIVGVGCGLMYSSKLLKVNPNRFTKIPPPKKKEKYLDYSANIDIGKVDIELKGTINSSTARSMIDDIKKKKNNSDSPIKFGTVTLLSKPDKRKSSEIIVCDDPPNPNSSSEELSFDGFITHYLDYLSFILDNSYYNRFVKRLWSFRRYPPRLPIKKIKNVYVFRGEEYLGEYFDSRLIYENILSCYELDIKLSSLFKRLTDKIGRTKYFIGISKTVFNIYNKRYEKMLSNYSSDTALEETKEGFILLDSDGVLIVKSIEGKYKQVEKRFTENDVKERLGYHLNFKEGNSHECGAPCRSRDIEGKPCEIKTYRGHCHFHR